MVARYSEHYVQIVHSAAWDGVSSPDNSRCSSVSWRRIRRTSSTIRSFAIQPHLASACIHRTVDAPTSASAAIRRVDDMRLPSRE